METIQQRLTAFKDNLKIIKEHNAQKLSYELGLNQFADLTEQEFIAMYTGLTSFNLKKDVNTIVPTGAYPATKDWIALGGVAAVKNQASCGSCYAFSAVTGLESLNFNKNKKLVTFSEQQLVDCSSAYGNQGCNGGWMHWCYDYTNVNGITTDAKYPYVGYA